MPVSIVGTGKPCPHHGFSGHPLDRDPLTEKSGNARKTRTDSQGAHESSTSAGSKRTNSEVNDIPEKKRRTSADSSTSTSGVDKPTKASSTKTQNDKSQDGIPDLSDIHLDGEETDSVPIYDTCSEIRKKIGAFLRRKDVNQINMLKAFKEQYHTSRGPARMDSRYLRRFRTMKHADHGNTNSVYYAAYVFFEKLRIKEGKDKSAHRLDMEAIWPNGVDATKPASNARITCIEGERPFKDQYGQWHIEGRF
ncbi:MAG: hypothetical protein M1820_006827 [Bogoriella megaspora]|nr:MAG: hypothetical protein M1820_006827 [Bogoriella megaspora]